MTAVFRVQRLLGFFSVKRGDLTNHGRSISFRLVETSKTGTLRAGSTVITCIGNFFYLSYHWAITLTLYCFVSGVENALSIANLQRTIFDSHCVGINYTAIALLSISYASIFSSIFAYQEPLFFFLFSTKGGFSMCVSVTVPLFQRRRLMGFRITRRRNGLAR